ncbi:MAG: glutamate synthase subunit beta [Polyangiaceae bacterium]|nr:glutamate synthase subunit beta [Polyangiaceae bacterium]
MGKVNGFLEYGRKSPKKRPANERVLDFREFELPVLDEDLKEQSARCMDCGVPFCNTGCPLGNLIPDWNDHAYQSDPVAAITALHATNNFPEFTGRVCPAPCEAACVLGINSDPVSIKLVERAVIDRAFEAGIVTPVMPLQVTGKKVAIVGSGPAGLAAAQQLARAGHSVVVFERDDRIGGLLMYGIPDFKMEKDLISRRVAQMQEEGVRFKTSVNVGVDVTLDQLRREFDAVCITIGSRVPRALEVPGSDLPGVHFAMDFLEQQNRRVAGETISDAAAILATGKNVVVIGGGDTGSDCIGTSHRQGAKSVTNFEIMPRPPEDRSPLTPWPLWPLMMRTSTSHEEGGTRDFSIATERVSGEGRVEKLHCVRVEWKGGKLERIAGTEFEVKADLVLLAMGFIHPEHRGLVADLGLKLDPRGNIAVDEDFMTSEKGIFAAGDCKRGQSLVVWAIAEGRKAAASIDRYLLGRTELAVPPLAQLR